jgi:hypothetical protein|tara:strand:+ start:5131 stop:5283 length:153 start_codon:yes stop_codon:yes gene_type:complete
MKYNFYLKKDPKKEAISTVDASSRLKAAKYFSYVKNLDLKSFLSIFKISR